MFSHGIISYATGFYLLTPFLSLWINVCDQDTPRTKSLRRDIVSIKDRMVLQVVKNSKANRGMDVQLTHLKDTLESRSYPIFLYKTQAQTQFLFSHPIADTKCTNYRIEEIDESSGISRRLEESIYMNTNARFRGEELGFQAKMTRRSEYQAEETAHKRVLEQNDNNNISIKRYANLHHERFHQRMQELANKDLHVPVEIDQIWLDARPPGLAGFLRY